jgi:UDP-N-acetylmuramyl pentapeptide phosphotransferase/UDP-N-acetylglucosamine-1-phosphate transferase
MIALLLLLTAALSTVLTRAAKNLSVRFDVLDIPTERSSHSRPMPRCGGAAIVVAALTAWLLGPRLAQLPAERAVLVPLVAGSLIAAAIGFWDDIRTLDPLTKILGQICAFVPALALSRVGFPTLPALLAIAVCAVWVVGLTNILNFMDGSDGLAAGTSVITGTTFCALAIGAGSLEVAWLALVVTAAALGFLGFNYPPASIFMGDAGSLFLGYTFAVLSILLVGGGVDVVAVLLGFTPFLFDATFTMVKRLSRGDRVWQAHRSHLYQRLLLAGSTHRIVAHGYYAWAVGSGALAVAYTRAGAIGRIAVLCVAASLAAGVLLWVWSGERQCERGVAHA